MTINPTIPTVGSPRGSEEIDIANALTTIVDAVNKGTGPAVVASLPLAPVDGQEVYFVADAVLGIIWHLKYRAASPSAFKWEVLGTPPPLSAAGAGTETTSSTVNTAAGFTAAAVTIPLAGDYEVTVQAYERNNTAGGAAIVAAVATPGAQLVEARVDSSTASNGVNAFGSARAAALAAAAVVNLQYRVSVGIGTWINRRLTVTPVRVG